MHIFGTDIIQTNIISQLIIVYPISQLYGSLGRVHIHMYIYNIQNISTHIPVCNWLDPLWLSGCGDQRQYGADSSQSHCSAGADEG